MYFRRIARGTQTCVLSSAGSKVGQLTRLAVLKEGCGDSDLPSAYQPLYMLNTARKVHENLIKLIEAI